MYQIQGHTEENLVLIISKYFPSRPVTVTFHFSNLKNASSDPQTCRQRRTIKQCLLNIKIITLKNREDCSYFVN